jgi:hypothetical protein
MSLPDTPRRSLDNKSIPERDVEKSGGSSPTDSVEKLYKDGSYAEEVELTPMEALKWNVDGDESPFPEVQACVPTTDDPTIQINRE